jgi:hypothetical protein
MASPITDMADRTRTTITARVITGRTRTTIRTAITTTTRATVGTRTRIGTTAKEGVMTGTAKITITIKVETRTMTTTGIETGTVNIGDTATSKVAKAIMDGATKAAKAMGAQDTTETAPAREPPPDWGARSN